MSDMKYALRTLAKSPGFTLAALTILAFGIGFNTAAFSLMDAVVLRPLPGIERPGELVDLVADGHAYPSYVGFRDGSGAVFSGLAAWAHRAVDLAAAGNAERSRGTVVSANYFELLGVKPALGRFFLQPEEESGDAVVVLSHGVWRQRFGSAPAVVGGVVRLNGAPFTVIGVAPEGFRGAGFATPEDLWIPVGAWPRAATGGFARLDYHGRSWGWLSIVGRLKPGADLARAQATIDLLTRRESAAFPKDVPNDYHVRLEPLSQTAAGSRNSADPIRFSRMLLGAVGVVLLIVCANLANLLLARAAGRRKEVAVRQALGASPSRLVRQLLTESLVLGLAGGAAGLLVASWSLALLLRLFPGGGGLAAFSPSLDLPVLVFALTVSILTGITFGLFPAVQASRVAPLAALKDEPAGGARRAVLREVLVGAQVALCLLLLAAAGLLVRSLKNALETNVGFEPRGVALASVQLGLERYDGPRALAFEANLIERVAALSSVRGAAWAGILPLSGDRDMESFEIEGEPQPPQGKRRSVDVAAVSPGYFRTLGVPMVAGREFDRAFDGFGGASAVVVNEAAARSLWPNQNPIGRRLTIYGAVRTVVGTCRDSRFRSLREDHVPLVYAPLDQLGTDGVLSSMTLLVRTTGKPSALFAPIKAEVARLDPSLPVFSLRTLEDSIASQLVAQRLGSMLLGVFALLSLLLAAIGIYGVVAASVARRVREMGIRLALGARPEELRRMILRQTAAPIAVGLAAGLALAAATTRLMERFLYGVTPADPATFAGAVLVLVLGGLLAADLPARRASRINPMEALRNE
jgi:predicted permease